MSEPLTDAITSLRVALREFTREASLPFADPKERLKALAAVVQDIGIDRPIKLRNCPDEYRAQWRDFLAGRRPDLEGRVLRFLCWEPEVAADQRFHDFLERGTVELSARGLQGLISSAHQRWSNRLAEGPVGASLRKRLQSYSGPNQRVSRWKQELRMVAGANGSSLFGERLAEAARPIAEMTGEWGFLEDSAFTRQAVAAAAQACGKQLYASSPLISFLVYHLIVWRGWDQAAFKDQLGNWVLSEHASVLEQLREGLKRIGIDRLGDPRVARNTAWLGVRDQARAEFLKWLSREDIVFFFEHVLPRGSDPHGRKDFWLKYVGRVRRSRPLLCEGDRVRLQNYERRSQHKIGHYGGIDGSSSAFLLDFGELLVAEFSVKGNACYIYDRSGAASIGANAGFWSPDPFSVASLKRRPPAIDKMTHHPVVWREKMTNLLARYGIRPGV